MGGFYSSPHEGGGKEGCGSLEIPNVKTPVTLRVQVLELIVISLVFLCLQ